MVELRFSFASARKQAQGLHFGLSERGKVARGGIVAKRSFCYPSDTPRQLHNATDAWHPCRAHADLLQ